MPPAIAYGRLDIYFLYDLRHRTRLTLALYRLLDISPLPSSHRSYHHLGFACCFVPISTLYLLASSYAISSAMYGTFPFENIELSPCFSPAICFFNVDERRAVSDFDEVPALDFDDVLLYPDDDEINEETKEKREEAQRIGLGLLFDEVSPTYACSHGGNAENINIFVALPREGVVEGTNLPRQCGINTRGVWSANPQTPLKRGGKTQDGPQTPSRTVSTWWYSRPYTMTGINSDGSMRPPRGGVPPELAREITRDNMVEVGRERKRKGEDGHAARKRMRY